MNISVIMPTARNNYCILGQPDLHFLKPTMEHARVLERFE